MVRVLSPGTSSSQKGPSAVDPQIAWDDLLEAYTNGDCAAVEDLADGLLHWLTHDGFPPQTVPNQGIDAELHRHLAIAACRFAKSIVRQRTKEDAR